MMFDVETWIWAIRSRVQAHRLIESSHKSSCSDEKAGTCFYVYGWCMSGIDYIATSLRIIVLVMTFSKELYHSMEVYQRRRKILRAQAPRAYG